MTFRTRTRHQDWPPGIDELQREMERFFDHLHPARRTRVIFSDRAWSPRVDLYEAAGQLVILAELAGVPRDQIQIEVEHDHLVLRGERRPQHRGDERTFHALEVPYGAFERLIHLPYPVDPGRAQATYRDGFLEIILPRTQPQQPRRVPVQTPNAAQ